MTPLPDKKAVYIISRRRNNAQKHYFGATLTETKYVLCRALNGFNDQLNMLQKCLKFAKETNRELIIDTSLGGLGRDYFDVFEHKFSDGVPIHSINDFTFEQLNGMSAWPDVIQGRIDTYECHEKIGTKSGFSYYKVRGTSFNFGKSLDKSRDEKLVVFHAGGGGAYGAKWLQWAKLKKHLADQILTRLVQLPKDLIAMHIRYSDVKVDADNLFALMREDLKGRNVLICTDNSGIRDVAKNKLDKSTNIILLSDLSYATGEAGHMVADIRTKEPFLNDLFLDIAAMSGAQQLMYTPATHRSGRPMVSGFARLGDRARIYPEWQKNLLSLGDKKLNETYFNHGPPSLPKSDEMMAQLTTHYPILYEARRSFHTEIDGANGVLAKKRFAKYRAELASKKVS